MSLNQDQKEHLEYLATVPPEKRCWCGWWVLADYSDGKRLPCGCPTDKTCADKLAAACPGCRNAPLRYGEGVLVHTINCPMQVKVGGTD
jgi:hypothetical protein